MGKKYYNFETVVDSVGASVDNRAITDILYVSPNGNNTGTDFVFNQGTRISASAKSVSGGNNAYVSLKIQEI